MCNVENSHRDVRRSGARNTFIAESVYLVLNQALLWPESQWRNSVKQRSDVT